MAQRTIGIIVAMPEEIKPLLKGAPQVVREQLGIFPLYSFSQHNHRFAVIESGIGADRALTAAQTLTEALNPELLISMGFGGGVSPGLQAGDIVIGVRFLVHKGKRMIEENGVRLAPLPEALVAELKQRGLSIGEGTIISTAGVQSKTVIAGQLPDVQKVLNPVFGTILPSTRFTVTLFFALLAPLAIYRGPFATVGTGAALLAMFLNAKAISPLYLYCVWRGANCLQGSQDPTNSWTLWTIGYTKVTHGQFLKTALPWGWLMVAINAFLAYVMVP